MIRYIPYDGFYPEVMPYFPGIPELLINNAIKNSCIEFCERSDYLIYTPQPQLVIAFEDEYDLTLDLPFDTVVSRVKSAWYDQLPLTPKDEEDLRRLYGLDWRVQVGTPQFFTQYDMNHIILVTTPTLTIVDGLQVTLNIRPAQSSTTVDPVLLERFHEVIAAGARSRLHATPGQAYENPKMADKYAAIYERGISIATIQRERGLTRVQQRVRPQALI